MKNNINIAAILLLIIISGLLVFKDLLRQQKNYSGFEAFVRGEVPFIMKIRRITGASIAIIKDGNIDQIITYGYANKERGIMNSPEKRFRIASLSKPVTAWGIMKLVQDGKIDLDQPVEVYLKRWKFPLSEFNSSEVTVRRLLTHTAGISVPMYGGYHPDKPRTTIIESLNGKNVAYGPVRIIRKPGTSTSYSGGGYSVLQLLIEDVTGESYEKYIEENILKPLGLKNYSYSNEQEDNPDIAMPYGTNGKKLPFFIYTELAAGGLICSAEDLATFALSFVNEQHVLSENAIEQMTDKNGIPIVGILKKDSQKCIGFGGTTLGYSADFWINTNTKNGYVLMSNSNSSVFLGAEIADYWLKENIATPDPGLKFFKIELYGIRMLSFALGWIFILLAWRKIMRIYTQKETIRLSFKKNYLPVRIMISIILVSGIVLWWLFFHTLLFYPPYQTPWLPASFLYMSIFILLIVVYIIINSLFIYRKSG